MYVDTAASISSQCLHLLSAVSVYSTHAQISLYHFSTVVTHATFGLLIVAAFLVSSNMPTADLIRSETIIVTRGDDPFSRLLLSSVAIL